MILLDTNIFIYLANGTINIKAIKQDTIAFSSISKIEALGYAKLTVTEQDYLEALFEECEQLDLNDAVIQQAIKFRRQVNMSIVDTIIAATASVYQCELYTANVKDFAHIEELRIHNPLNN